MLVPFLSNPVRQYNNELGKVPSHETVRIFTVSECLVVTYLGRVPFLGIHTGLKRQQNINNKP